MRMPRFTPLMATLVTRSKRALMSVAVLMILALSACSTDPAEHLQAAEQALADEKPALAVIELKNAVQKDPQLAKAWTLLGQIRLSDGDLEIGLEELQKALAIDPQDDAAKLALLRTKNALGRSAEVLAALDDAAALAPEFAVALGDAKFATGDVDRAVELYEQGKHLPQGLYGLGQVAHLSNDLETALAHLTSAVELDPRYRNAQLYKGEIELQMGKGDAAAETFLAAKRLRGNAIPPRMGMVRAELVRGDLDAADQNASALISVGRKYAQAHYMKALVKYRKQDFEAAENALLNVQKFSRDHLPGLYLMGVVQANLGNLDRATRNLERYIELEPENASVRKLLASVLGKQDDSRGVVDLLQPFAPTSNDPQVWAMLGRAYEKTGQTADATVAFERAVELAPDTAPFRNQLALSLLSAGEGAAALEHLESAVEIDGDQLQSEYIKVMLQMREQDFAGARRSTDEIIAKRPNDPQGHNLRGTIALTQDDLQGAENAFNAALKVDPEFFPAANGLAQIAERRSDFETAHSILTRFAEREGVDEQPLMALVDLNFRAGNIDAGIGLLEEGVNKFPASVPIHVAQLRTLLATGRLSEALQTSNTLLNLAPTLPDAKLLDAEVALRQGDRERAQERAQQLQELLPQHEGTLAVYAAVGVLQQRLGNLTLARRNLERAAEDGKGSISAIISLVRLELAEGSPRLAQAQLATLDARGHKTEEVTLLQGDVLVASNQEAAALRHFAAMANSGSRAGTSRYATLALQQNKVREAERALNDWLRENPNDEGMKSLLASAQVQAGKAGTAKLHYEAMLPTKDPVVLNNLAWIYMVEGNAAALDMARQANAAAPNNPDIADTLGWILVSKGEVQEGLGFLKASARSRPNNPTVQYHLGIAYHQVGEVARAKRALKKAVSLGDFDEINDARRVLAEL